MSLIDIVDPEGVKLAAEKSASGKRHLNRAAPGTGKHYAYFKAYYERNREKLLAAKKKWSADNHDWDKRRKREWQRRRRAAIGNRQRRGEAVPTSKLTAEKVIEMRTRYAAGEAPLAQLASHYGIAPSMAWKIIRRKAWAHIHGPDA